MVLILNEAPALIMRVEGITFLMSDEWGGNPAHVSKLAARGLQLPKQLG